MRRHDLVIGLVVIGGCVPGLEREDPERRHFSGVEWEIDDDGRVLATRSVLVERTEAGAGHVLGSDGVIPLAGSLRGGVLRVVDLRASGKRVLDLTPVSADDFDERVRTQGATAAPSSSSLPGLIERNR